VEEEKEIKTQKPRLHGAVFVTQPTLDNKKRCLRRAVFSLSTGVKPKEKCIVVRLLRRSPSVDFSCGLNGSISLTMKRTIPHLF
jgi:hypothetical protein